MDTLRITILIGIIATLVIDLWSIVRCRVFGVTRPDYALVGRWIRGLR